MMDPFQWKIINKILDEALGISDSEKRKAYIKSACGDNEELKFQVNNMLTSIKEVNETDFLE